MVTNHRNQRRLGQTIVILLVVLGVTASSAQAAQENGGSELSRNNWISAPTNSNHDAFNQLLARAKSLFTTDGLGQPVNDKLQKELDEAEKNKSITQVRAIIQKELSKKKPAISSSRQLNASERRLDSPVHIDDVPLFTFDDETPWKTTTCINTNQTTLVVTNNKELNWKLTARLDAFTIDPQKVNNRTALVSRCKIASSPNKIW